MVQRVYMALGVAQVGSAAALFIAWLKSESVLTWILLAVGAAVVSLLRWALGQLIKIAQDKVKSWDENFVTMGETLKDTPRMADHRALDSKVDELTAIATRTTARLDEHSGRIGGLEGREKDDKEVTKQALGLAEKALDRLRMEGGRS